MVFLSDETSTRTRHLNVELIFVLLDVSVVRGGWHTAIVGADIMAEWRVESVDGRFIRELCTAEEDVDISFRALGTRD